MVFLKRIVFTIIQWNPSKITYLMLLLSTLSSQNLEDLSFGDDASLDIATWNIEWFPKNDQTTVDYVSDIISLMDLDILAIQEVDDTVMFDPLSSFEPTLLLNLPINKTPLLLTLPINMNHFLR